MKPIDKYGRPIYSNVFLRLKRIGNALTKLNYRESIKKPNLFYRILANGGLIFADMRGSEIIPIWEDPRPLIYWKLDELKGQINTSTVQAIILNELQNFRNSKIVYRLSFEFTMHPSWPFENVSVSVLGDGDFDEIYVHRG